MSFEIYGMLSQGDISKIKDSVGQAVGDWGLLLMAKNHFLNIIKQCQPILN
jgi:hypothetical protein